jgi:hypothetical protein
VEQFGVATNATHPTGEPVTAFLDSVADERRRTDGHALRLLLEEVTGERAAMWGSSIVGVGTRANTNTAGTSDWFIVGFSPRKAALTIYGIRGDDRDPDPLLGALGPHTTGKGCVYLKRLDQIDRTVLEQLVRKVWLRSCETT